MEQVKRKMVIAIIQADDRRKLGHLLVERGFRATQLNSTGGFLHVGNATLMIGVEESKLIDLLNTIQEVCLPRQQIISDPTYFGDESPIEITIGGATVFIMDIDQYIPV